MLLISAIQKSDSVVYTCKILFRILFCYSLLEDIEYSSLSCGLPGNSVIKTLPANAGDAQDRGLIPELGRCPGGDGNPLQYSCLENPMDRGAWRATVPGVTKESDMT